MNEVTITTADATRTYPDAFAAAKALLSLMGNDQLGGELWLKLVRREKQRRLDSGYGPRGETGSHVVTSVR